MNERKIVLFGGVFDPVHLGHTAVAASAGEQIGADKVVFVPAKRSPLKAFCPEAGDEDRLAMLKLAISDNDSFEFSEYELKKQGPSYTLETVRYFQNQLGPHNVLYWLVGSDCLQDLLHWYGIADLLDESNLAVMFRGGFKPPDFSNFETLWGRQRIEKLQQNVIKTPLIEISSTDIRKRLSKGHDVSGMVCPEVLRYIREHGLYGSQND
jgi:nicotinate-nucleotide adenylyltransferase